MMPMFAPLEFCTWVETHPPCPPPMVTIGNFTRKADPPIVAFPTPRSGWTFVRHKELFRFDSGESGIYILQQLDSDDDRSLREHTLFAPNVFAYMDRLRILYRLIGEVALTARESGRVFCVLFITLFTNRTKILCELVAAHGAQLHLCRHWDRTESWVTFDGTEEQADNFRIEEAVIRATAVTKHGL
jgi:hypothetical protein